MSEKAHWLNVADRLFYSNMRKPEMNHAQYNRKHGYEAAGRSNTEKYMGRL